MLEKILTFFLKSRNVYRRDNKLYLTRYYVFRKFWWWLPSVYIHCFHSSDEDLELHNHPWSYSLSLILSGSYREEFRKDNFVKNRILGFGCFNFIKANKFHRVDLLSNRVWTLFISGPKVQDWGFWNRTTKEYWSWRQFVSRKRNEEII